MLGKQRGVPKGSSKYWDDDMKILLKNLWNDESGASAAEYALILAVIGSVIAIAAIGLADSIGGAMDNASNCIDAPSNTTC